jgi:hypothetical protein
MSPPLLRASSITSIDSPSMMIPSTAPNSLNGGPSLREDRAGVDHEDQVEQHHHQDDAEDRHDPPGVVPGRGEQGDHAGHAVGSHHEGKAVSNAVRGAAGSGAGACSYSAITSLSETRKNTTPAASSSAGKADAHVLHHAFAHESANDDGNGGHDRGLDRERADGSVVEGSRPGHEGSKELEWPQHHE